MRIQVALVLFVNHAIAQTFVDLQNCRLPSFDDPVLDANGVATVDAQGNPVTVKKIVQVDVPQWNDPAQTIPTLDINGVQVTVKQNAPCIVPDQGLQWENQAYDSSTSLWELYDTDKSRIINDDLYTGDITIARRAQYPSLYFQRPVTDYDGCYNRVPSVAEDTPDTYWGLQTIIDTSETTIQKEISNMCKADLCMYNEIGIYLTTASWATTRAPSGTDLPWTQFLLTDAEYDLKKTAEKTIKDIVSFDESSWKKELQEVRKANHDNVKINCENSGVNTFNSQINSFATKEAADAYFTGLDISTFDAAEKAFNDTYSTWNSAEIDKESKDWLNRKASAALSGWFGNVMTVANKDVLLFDEVKLQSITDNSSAQTASTNAAADFQTSSTVATTKFGEYQTAQSTYSSVCPVQQQKTLWEEHKTEFDKYMDWTQKETTAANSFNFVDWPGSIDSTVQSLAGTMANWANGADAATRANNASFITDLKKADPLDVALAIEHQKFKTEGTATPFSAVASEINTIISTFNSEISATRNAEITTLNTSNAKTLRASWITAANPLLTKVYGSSGVDGWLAFEKALAPLQNPDSPAVAPTGDYVDAGLYKIMKDKKALYDAAVTATADQLLLWQPWQETYAVIARTNAAGEILNASGQPAIDLDVEMAKTDDAADWNKYASKMKNDYDLKVSAEATARTAYWTAIEAYAVDALLAWDYYDQGFASTQFNAAKAFAVTFSAEEYGKYEALCLEKRAVQTEWQSRVTAQSLIVAEKLAILTNAQFYNGQFTPCKPKSSFNIQRQEEYDMLTAKAQADYDRENDILTLITTGLGKTTDVVNVVCPNYDKWQDIWSTWNARQYQGPTQYVPIVYDCAGAYIPDDFTYNREWCNGVRTLTRPCTLTKADYLSKVAAVTDWHNTASVDQFNSCACDGQSPSCQRLYFDGSKPQVVPASTVTVPVTTLNQDFNQKWTKAKAANTDLLAWEAVLPIHDQAKKINECKLTVYPAAKTAIAAAEAKIIEAEAKQQLTDPLEWSKQNKLYESWWTGVKSQIPSEAKVSEAFNITTITVTNAGEIISTGSAGNNGGQKVRGLQSLDLNAPAMPNQGSTVPVITPNRDDRIIYDGAQTHPGNAVANWLDFAQDLYRPPIDSFYGMSKERGIGPVAMTTCTNTAGDFSGVQVFFGQYMHKAGASHGDMTGTCSKTLLEAPIQCIEFYYGVDVGTTSTIVGMNATMWPDRDGAENQVAITVGKVGTVGANMFKKCFPLDNTNNTNNTRSEFFGFKSTTDSTRAISTLDIIIYKPETLYGALYYQVSNATFTSAESQKVNTAFRKLISNDLVGQIPVPTGQANVAGVYRPEQYRQDLEVINIAIAQIEEQKAADAAKAAENQAAADEAAATALDNETATQLTAALLDHSEDEREANTGALVAAIIGGIILIGLLGFCCMRMCTDKRRSEMAGARGTQGQQIRVNNSSMRSDAMGSQGKLDDIM